MADTLQDWSARPDDNMRWIYKWDDPRYSDPATVALRERRDAALRAVPQYMFEIGIQNDERRDEERRVTLAKQGRIP